MNKEEYIPVNCSLYDRYEALAVQGARLDISIKEGQNSKLFKEVSIKTLETIGKEEFMILRDGERFRLDQVLCLAESDN